MSARGSGRWVESVRRSLATASVWALGWAVGAALGGGLGWVLAGPAGPAERASPARVAGYVAPLVDVFPLPGSLLRPRGLERSDREPLPSLRPVRRGRRLARVHRTQRQADPRALAPRRCYPARSGRRAASTASSA